MVPWPPSKHLSSARIQLDGRFCGERCEGLPNRRGARHLLDLKRNEHLADNDPTLFFDGIAAEDADKEWNISQGIENKEQRGRYTDN